MLIGPGRSVFGANSRMGNPGQSCVLVVEDHADTLRFLLPQPVFGAIGALARLRTTPSYAFHAVDFLDLARDGLDPRMCSRITKAAQVPSVNSCSAIITRPAKS